MFFECVNTFFSSKTSDCIMIILIFIDNYCFKKKTKGYSLMLDTYGKGLKKEKNSLF